MKIPFILITLLFGISAGVTDYRLSRSVVPYVYNLTINATNINTKLDHFDGRVEMAVVVLDQTNRIVLHISNMTIMEINVLFQNDTELTETSIEIKNEFLILHFDKNLREGSYVIQIYYKGQITSQVNDGFYKTSFKPIHLPTRYLAVTQFQTTQARRAFPCFDEPAIRANFTIHVFRNKYSNSISNMPILKSKVYKADTILDTFETTPEIPTHRVAFGVTQQIQSAYNRGHFYHDPSYTKVPYSVSIANESIAAVEDYLQMPLPAKKLDLILLDEDLKGYTFGSWGLIQLSQFLAFYKPEMWGKTRKQTVFTTILQEILHQWFSNLVTIKWWNYLWINHGIARLLSYTIGDALSPKWRLKEQIAMIALKDGVAFDLDNDTSLSHEVKNVVNYTKLSGSKSSTIFLTLRNIVGEKCFRKALQWFLRKYKYSSVKGMNVWDAFNTTYEKTNRFLTLHPRSRLILAEVMKSWENLAGVPVLDVKRVYSPPYIQLSQSKLRSRKNNQTTVPSIWYIPINFAAKANPDFNSVLPTEWLSTSFKYIEDLSPKEDWLIVNKQASFYYLVNYDERNWKMITTAINSENYGNIPALTRAKLFFDAFALAESDHLNYTVALELTKYLRKEKDYIVWNAFFSGFKNFYKYFCQLENFHYYEAFLADALQPSLEYLGVAENQTSSDDEQHIDNLHRIQIIKWACLLGNKFCRNITMEKVKRGLPHISNDLKEVVLCGALRGADTWDFGDDYVGNALGCAEDKNVLSRYTKSLILQDADVSEFKQIYSNGCFGLNFILDYLGENPKLLASGISTQKRATIIADIAKYIYNEQQLTKLRFIESSHRLFSHHILVSKATSEAEKNIDWVEFHSDEINNWIKQNYGPKPKAFDFTYIVLIGGLLLVGSIIVCMGYKKFRGFRARLSVS